MKITSNSIFNKLAHFIWVKCGVMLFKINEIKGFVLNFNKCIKKLIYTYNLLKPVI